MLSAQALSPQPDEASQPAIQAQLLTFLLGADMYAIDIMQVREVKGWSETTRLPNSPDYLRGVLNLRGAIVPIFDLRMRLTQEMTQPEESHVIIILSLETRVVGILVDAVCDILTVAADAFKAPPQMESASEDAPVQSHVKSLIVHHERMVVVLDLGSLIGEKDAHPHPHATATTAAATATIE